MIRKTIPTIVFTACFLIMVGSFFIQNSIAGTAAEIECSLRVWGKALPRRK